MRQESEDLIISSAFTLDGELVPADEVDVVRFNSSMDAVNYPDELLREYKRVVPARLKVDTLVGRGVSGTVAVTHLARDLGLNSLVIRKDGPHHAMYPAEGYLGKNWLFVDDLIASGATFIRTWETIRGLEERLGFRSNFKGAFLYEDVEYRTTHVMLRKYNPGAWIDTPKEWTITIGERK